jgi:hypothetical protein
MQEFRMLCLFYYLYWFCDNWTNLKNVKKYHFYNYGNHGENTQTLFVFILQTARVHHLKSNSLRKPKMHLIWSRVYNLHTTCIMTLKWKEFKTSNTSANWFIGLGNLWNVNIGPEIKSSITYLWSWKMNFMNRRVNNRKCESVIFKRAHNLA